MSTVGFHASNVMGFFNDDLRAYCVNFKHQIKPEAVEQAYTWLVAQRRGQTTPQPRAILLNFTQVHHFHIHFARAFQTQTRVLDHCVDTDRLPTLFFVHSDYQEQMALMLEHICHLRGRTAVCKSPADVSSAIRFFEKCLVIG